MISPKMCFVVSIAVPMLGSVEMSVAQAEEIPTLRQLDEGQAQNFVSPFGALGAGGEASERESRVQQERAREENEIERLAQQNWQIDRKLPDEICDGC
jgi:hypothetical protein